MKDYFGHDVAKTLYVLIFQDGNHFKEKIQRICDSFMGKRYQLPDGGHGDVHSF